MGGSQYLNAYEIILYCNNIHVLFKKLDSIFEVDETFFCTGTANQFQILPLFIIIVQKNPQIYFIYLY